MNIQKVENEELIDYLQNEILILTECDHPNIIKLYAVFYEDNYVHMILEKCEKPLY